MAEIKQNLDSAIANLTEIIDTTHCGYCKAIVGDAREILTSYESLMDKAEKVDQISREQKAFLTETNNKADEMINSYALPHTAPSPQQTIRPMSRGGMMPRPNIMGNIMGGNGGIMNGMMPNGRRMSKMMSRPMINQFFGDFFNMG